MIAFVNPFGPFVRPVALLVLLGFVTAGCAGRTDVASGQGPTVIGDQRGGKIPRGVDDTPAAMNAAVAHCARFGKKAQLTQMEAPSQGGLMAFECR